ncbi:MAG: glycosyltransferase family 2 protein [Selenomonas sp.]|uniref:glycosyltransferase family 2 protein n=1 Tax=Selenomonas sp. TaxID=2053611 RepID=UPI0025D9188A|nr:glycosyltransferase family 2 protein [Selenomonas sp.]MCR5757025.1 glycosyltransferase family 2 protein [Selenomonas sp.]
MPKLAVIILTKNEEENIGEAIESAAFAEEVLVIDSGSTDRTQEIAEKHGAKFIVHPMGDEGFAGQRNFALLHTDADWVFYLDADERITSAAARDIYHAIHSTPVAAYRIKRINIVFGQPMKYGEHAPDWCVRLFPRESVQWEGVVHETPQTQLPIKAIAHFLHHYTYSDWEKYFEKFNQYTSLMAKRMLKKGKRASFGDILVHPFFAFVRFYFLRLGFMDGKQGLIFALNHYFYTMIKYVKLYYAQREGR